MLLALPCLQPCFCYTMLQHSSWRQPRISPNTAILLYFHHLLAAVPLSKPNSPLERPAAPLPPRLKLLKCQFQSQNHASELENKHMTGPPVPKNNSITKSQLTQPETFTQIQSMFLLILLCSFQYLIDHLCLSFRAYLSGMQLKRHFFHTMQFMFIIEICLKICILCFK